MTKGCISASDTAKWDTSHHQPISSLLSIPSYCNAALKKQRKKDVSLGNLEFISIATTAPAVITAKRRQSRCVIGAVLEDESLIHGGGRVWGISGSR